MSDSTYRKEHDAKNMSFFSGVVVKRSFQINFEIIIKLISQFKSNFIIVMS